MMRSEMRPDPINASIFVIYFLPAPPCAQQPPAIRFHATIDFLKASARPVLGEVSGVAVNSKGHVFVFSRGNSTGPAYGAAAAQFLEFGPDGKFIREIGHNLYAWSFAHAVRVDKDDNIWVIDKGSDMIIKFNPEGRVVMVFGRKKEASDEGAEPVEHPNPPLPAIDGQFRQPTDVTWDTAGNIFISDGYINSRVAKFDKNGDWVKQWGERGSGTGQFNTPHSIAADAQGNIYVADRGNRRIQVFDQRRKISATDHTIDVPVTMRTPPRIGNKPTAATARCAQARPGPFASRPGRPVSLQRRRLSRARLQAVARRQGAGRFRQVRQAAKQFGWIHEIACPSENELYVAEILNWRVQKLIL